MNLALNDEKLLELQTELQKLKESDFNLAKTKAEFSELELILRKQKQQSLHAFSNKINSLEGGDMGYSDTSLIKQGSKGNIPSTTASSESLKNKTIQVQKRIRQFYQTMDNIDVLNSNEKAVEGKNKFLSYLERMNSETWKIQKKKHPVVAKIDKYLKAATKK